MKKILITGNHTCGNRGDAAILRGLMDELKRQHPDFELTVLSRFPVSSAHILQYPVEVDQFNLYRQRKASGIIRKVLKLITNKYLSIALLRRYLKPEQAKYFPIPSRVQMEIEKLKKFDAVIQVGASFFVDVYGVSQFDYCLATLISKKPLFIIGHSVGPFRDPLSKQMAETVFNNADAFVLREPESKKQLELDKVEIRNAILSTDTAWLIDPLPEYIAKQKNDKLIAVTFRGLAPFDQILGISQDEYELAFAKFIDALHERGYLIRALSTCTGIDGYPKDDRMPALRVQRLCKQPDKIDVVMDELNDLELGLKFSECILTIGTRLHSAIISMNFGTPSLALSYEHKATGMMANLDLPELAKPVNSLMDGSLLAATLKSLDEIDTLNQKVAISVQKQKRLASNTIREIFEASKL